MSELSPAAQTVLAAYYCEKPLVGSKRIAAALRVVADQVVPEPPTWEIGVLSAADREVEIRRELLAIADELENHQ